MPITEVSFLIGRIILGGYFLFNAFNHFTRLGMMSGYAKSKGVPMPTVAVLGTGVLLALGGLSILLGALPVGGVICVVVFFLGVTPIMHNFWAVQDPMAKQLEMVNFLKNAALLGALLMLLTIPQPWPVSLVLGQ
ncbi:MAG: hypothetical protein Kow00120_24520 [Anaerolineae bacterium]